MKLHDIQTKGLYIGARVRLPAIIWDDRAGPGTIIDTVTAFGDNFWVVKTDAGLTVRAFYDKDYCEVDPL